MIYLLILNELFLDPVAYNAIEVLSQMGAAGVAGR
jgi:hypothetical protein